jgi:hypothetical protein
VAVRTYTKPQKQLRKSKSVFLKHKRRQKESQETKAQKVPAFVEGILFQGSAKWPFFGFSFVALHIT